MIIKKNQIKIVLMVILMAVLTFPNLNNRYLCYNEAHTALIGLNVLEYGLPKVWNGEYIVTTSNGNDFDDSLVIINDGYVHYYFAALGESLRSWCHPRTVFALLGVVSSVVIYLLAKQISCNVKLSLLSMFVYCTSIPIILYIRQMYYYAPAIFFISLTMLAYLLAIRYHKNRFWLFFSISSIFLYHTLHLFFMIIMISLFFRYIVFDKSEQNIKKVLISLCFVFACTFPFFLHDQMSLMSVGNQCSPFQGWYFFFLQIPGYLSQINAYFFPFISLGIIYGLMKICDRVFEHQKISFTNDGLTLLKRKKIDSNLFLLFIVIIINVIVISAFSVQYVTHYLLPSILMTNILCAIAIYNFFKKDRVIGFIIGFILIFTNILNVTPYILLKSADEEMICHLEIIIKPPVPYFIARGNYITVDSLGSYLENKVSYTSYLIEYFQEISTDYDDATEGVVLYLLENANSDDMVEADDFVADSIAYNTELLVVNRLRHTNNKESFRYSLSNNVINVKKYQHLTYYPNNLVKWRVILPNSKEEAESIQENVDTSQYEIIEITGYPNSLFGADIWEHVFYTDYSYPNAIILRNKEVL